VARGHRTITGTFSRRGGGGKILMGWCTEAVITLSIKLTLNNHQLFLLSALADIFFIIVN
jgi:hypothetical protein